MRYRSQEEEEEWRVHNYEARHHYQHQPKNLFPFVKLPSLGGKSDLNVYLGWEAKVDFFFNVYEVEEDQKVKLAFLYFLDYVMQW